MLKIDSDFPGGNIIVDKLDGDEVWLYQDPRDTEGWWFYWCCRAAAPGRAAARTLTFHFTDGNVLTPLGPSISTDRVHWSWTNAEVVEEGGDEKRKNVRAAVRLPEAAGPVYLTYSIPYQEAQLRAFVAKHRARPELRVSALTTSERGRTVEKLTVRRPGAHLPAKVLLTARHHACESVANYVMEGIIEFALDPATGFLERAEILAVPFVDKDGVENGDQGKQRRPHDHNRDYTGEPIYASTRALMRELDEWAGGRLDLALDLHCPWIRGGSNEHVFLVEPPEPNMPEFRRFAGLLAASSFGAIRYDGKNDIACGVGWNKGEDPTSARWFREKAGARVGCTLEFPYAIAGGETVTAARAREFGRALGGAVLAYLDGA